MKELNTKMKQRVILYTLYTIERVWGAVNNLLLLLLYAWICISSANILHGLPFFIHIYVCVFFPFFTIQFKVYLILIEDHHPDSGFFCVSFQGSPSLNLNWLW